MRKKSKKQMPLMPPEIDHTQAVEADIGTHTVSYTVKSKDYSGIVSDLSGTFTFTIACPDNVMSSTLDTPT